MKKRVLKTAVLALVVAAMGQPVKAQLKLPPASSSQTLVQGLGIRNVTLTYSRPNVNGRTIFGGLEPYDKVWRTGANGIPTITFEDKVTVAGHPIEPGTYGLLTIPGKSEWTVIFSKNSQQWGAYSYKQEEDVLRFTVKPERLSKPVETFTMDFSDVKPQSAKLNLAWEKTKIGFDLVVNQDAEIMAAIEDAMKGEKKPYMQAAQYYYNNNKDIQKALAWINEADNVPNPPPYVKYWKARIQLKAGDKASAATTAQQGIEIARQQNNEEYVRLNERVLAEAKK